MKKAIAEFKEETFVEFIKQNVDKFGGSKAENLHELCELLDIPITDNCSIKFVKKGEILRLECEY